MKEKRTKSSIINSTSTQYLFTYYNHLDLLMLTLKSTVSSQVPSLVTLLVMVHNMIHTYDRYGFLPSHHQKHPTLSFFHYTPPSTLSPTVFLPFPLPSLYPLPVGLSVNTNTVLIILVTTIQTVYSCPLSSSVLTRLCCLFCFDPCRCQVAGTFLSLL